MGLFDRKKQGDQEDSHFYFLVFDCYRDKSNDNKPIEFPIHPEVGRIIRENDTIDVKGLIDNEEMQTVQHYVKYRTVSTAWTDEKFSICEIRLNVKRSDARTFKIDYEEAFASEGSKD
jgi:hypothetical protein